MRTFVTTVTLLTASAWCAAQTTTPEQPSNEQVIQPQVDRRDVKVPKYPSKDFEIGLYGGTYATQNFGSSFVGGVRLGYHISEDIFVQGAYADQGQRRELRQSPGGIFAQPTETLVPQPFSGLQLPCPAKSSGVATRPLVRCTCVIGALATPISLPATRSATTARPSTTAWACACCSIDRFSLVDM
jgi:hypothetical protein